MPSRPRRVSLAVASAVLVGVAALLLLGWGQPTLSARIGGGVAIGFTTFAMAGAMYSAKRAQFKGVRAFTPGMRLDATELQLSAGQPAFGHWDAVDRIQLLGDAAMTYLRELPIDEIKLDREFVAPILRDLRAAAIVESVIDLADTFGIACVAEGVEDKATADRLKEYGFGYVQGHYFSTPVPGEAIRLGIWRSRLKDDRVTQSGATPPSSA